MAKFEWSSYQNAIFDAFVNSKQNIFVNATAGASKTSTMVECVRRGQKNLSYLFMAFNKSIADELKEKLPPEVECATFHSKGFKILSSYFKTSYIVDENKCFKIAKKCLDLDSIAETKKQNAYLFNLQEIWNQIRINFFVDCEKDIPTICLEKEIDFKERMIDDIKKIEQEWSKYNKNLFKEKTKFQVDFTDMLWLPYNLIDPLSFPKYDMIMIDEGQDLNVIQRELVFSMIKPKGRFMICGDFSQSIYSFQGASIANFTYFAKRPNTITLPLSITYRCARQIVEEAKKTFPEGIEAAPTAVEGIVRQGELSEANEGDFVLCRNNLPLVEAFIYFLERNKKASIKGRDFGEALVRLLNKVSSFDELLQLLENKRLELREKGYNDIQIVNNPSYIALQEKIEIIRMINERLNLTFSMIKEKVLEIFTDKTSGIVLCTIHRSKGLEAERVFFLNSELIPSEHAKTETQLYAEKCLRFVAVTRAKKELVYCHININK